MPTIPCILILAEIEKPVVIAVRLTYILKIDPSPNPNLAATLIRSNPNPNRSFTTGQRAGRKRPVSCQGYS